MFEWAHRDMIQFSGFVCEQCQQLNRWQMRVFGRKQKYTEDVTIYYND